MPENATGTSNNSKVSVPVTSSGALKRKIEHGQDSAAAPPDAKIRKIDQSTSTVASTVASSSGTKATPNGANTQAVTVNGASSSGAIPDAANAVPSPTGKESTVVGEWTCADCTFRNHPALDACEMCTTPKNAFEMLKRQLEEMKNKTSVILPPSHWLSVDPGTRVKRVKLAENDKTYLEISKRLSRCCSTSHCKIPFVFTFTAVRSLFVSSASQHQFEIEKIERIENLHLYQMYSVRKSQMDEVNGSVLQNERMIWHGTSHECVDNITSYGFNRSHCGKNGTRFGKGVYFSTTPCYSASSRYATPDKNGFQYMFYSRVLTGRFTLGDETMVEPPMRRNNLGRFNSLADCLDQPSIFVIFHDAQAYPEYLITFKYKQ